ncbi:hypothetical protein B296_00007524 [Ensete ventricosum]|uniref:Uncharacterized protein n=1 Tax=Ensete ventricosum TaxID=4639 RepID=A0A426ZNR7_ENSVE|nr:hypothetical protein B296_00007524 [Ensete ventricosum]
MHAMYCPLESIRTLLGPPRAAERRPRAPAAPQVATHGDPKHTLYDVATLARSFEGELALRANVEATSYLDLLAVSDVDLPASRPPEALSTTWQEGRVLAHGTGSTRSHLGVPESPTCIPQ